METEKIVMERSDALELYREYRRSKNKETKIDGEIKRTYRAISKGQVVIKALESIGNAGLKADGFPALAICRANASHCEVSMEWNGAANFFAATKDGAVTTGKSRWNRSHSKENKIAMRTGSFPITDRERARAVAIVPQAPLHLRPTEADMAKYHILWEAEWSPIPPRDPMLLRRIGNADLWIVVAHWDLTEVERAALATRI